MASSVVVAYDVGTSGVKAVVAGADGRVRESRIRTYGLTTPRAGWVEQDVDAIVAALGEASRDVLAAAGVDVADVAAVGLTAQMFSLVPVDADGRALRPMLSWLDQRAAGEAERLRRRCGEDEGYVRFDAVLTAKDIVPRIVWLLEREPDVASRTAWYLDCKEAVLARLTGSVATDPAGASAFRLTDPVTGEWDADRCAVAGVPVERLPLIRPAFAVAGRLTADGAAITGLRPGTAVVTGMGDVPASQVGSGAIGAGDTHLSLGTAVYFGITSDRRVADPGRRLGPLAHGVPGEWIVWLEVATGGAALTWASRLLAGLGAGGSSRPDRAGRTLGGHAAIDLAVEAVADEMEELLFAPWLTGERVPLFDDAARAAFVGLRLHHGPAHLVRAVMEGVACQIAWAFEYGSGYGVEPRAVRGVGGGSIGRAWTRIIAETLGRPLEIVADPQDAAARGAAACALVGAGLAADLRTAVGARIERIVVPDSARVDAARRRLARFRQLYPSLRPSWSGDPAPAVHADGAVGAVIAAADLAGAAR